MPTSLSFFSIVPDDARQLLEIVGGAARTRQALEAGRGSPPELFLDDRPAPTAPTSMPDVALAARDAVDRRAGDQVAIQRDGAAGVVIARHHDR